MTEHPTVVLIHGAFAAFGLDEGESIAALDGAAPPVPARANLVVDEHGFGRLPEDDFAGHFAADVGPVKVRVMHAGRQSVSMSVFDGVMGTSAGPPSPTSTSRTASSPWTARPATAGRTASACLAQGVGKVR